MKFTQITRDQFYERLTYPFNPPYISDEQSEDKFFSEWHVIRNKLLAVLGRFGENSDYDDKDFSLGDIAMLSRGMGVVFTNKKMFNPEVMEAIDSFLQTLEEDYEVNVMLQEDGVGQHALFISKVEVLSDLPDRLRDKVIPPQWLKEKK